MSTRRAATTPAAVAAALGVVAYAAGATKKWVLSPIGTTFGNLTPDGKVIVTALVVVGILGLLFFARLQHRNAVQSTRRSIDRAAPTPDATAQTTVHDPAGAGRT